MSKQKSKQVKVNFSIYDYENILELAKSENISMAQLIRNKLNVKVKNSPVKKSTVINDKSEHKLLFELNSIRISLNKIVENLDSNNAFSNLALFEIYQKIMSLK